MVGRPNPFRGLEEVFERLNRQFEDAARTWESDVDTRVGFGWSVGDGSNGLDVAEYDEEFVVTVDVPGYEKEDIEVRLSGETLHVAGERERETDEEADTYLRRERTARSFSRRVRLPDPVDAEDVSASVDNGVLTVTLAKLEPASASRSIDIE
ncbi:Hsp20/alpha crystallin family protein [Natrononativus amylolyticus]|uniref:Hsp20/alpha crystallin family protein n=1 Tax=Natrononativus amylolyticus TaxID=2963434 RepID=UPI0020CFAAD0|nr:Hsp20/alpha crystallin family protein [Natrononativus amylolyticus]